MSNSTPDPFAHKDFWNKRHGQELGDNRKMNPFAIEAEHYFRPLSSILELGCGQAPDAVYFDNLGFEVLATDFSEVVIAHNKQALAHTAVEFETLDMSQPLPYEDEQFDNVYAHLSTHYYDEITTVQIFSEAARVLKVGGVFAFNVKSVNDQHYGKGKEVGKNIFLTDNGHLRHFFTVEEVEELLAGKFEIDITEEVVEDYDGEMSHIIRCIARKKDEL